MSLLCSKSGLGASSVAVPHCSRPYLAYDPKNHILTVIPRSNARAKVAPAAAPFNEGLAPGAGEHATMVEKPQAPDMKTVDTSADAAATATATATPPPRRPGHRGADVRDTVAEMAARAQEISLEAGSKIAAAMKDVIGAAAGITGFAVESARDLVQYMVRRGQMTQDEADKLLREVEESQGTRRPAASASRAQSRAEPGRVESTRLEPDGKRGVPSVTVPPPPPTKPAAAKPSKPSVQRAPARASAPARPAKKAAARSASRAKPAAAKKRPTKAAKKKR